MSTKARVRPRPVARSLPLTSLPPVVSAPPEVAGPDVAAAVCPAPPPGEEARVYWGDRVGVLFWAGCFALLGGIILAEAIVSFLQLLLG
jgi:hypothetical protein